MIRIAIAVNDFISGHCFFEMANKIKADPKTKDIGLGLGQYSIRITIGHLSEALLLIDNPNDKIEPSLDNLPSLKRYIDTLSSKNKKYYDLLRKSLKGGPDREKFETYVENFRNRISCHYDAGYRGRRDREAPVSKEALDYIVKHGKRIGHMQTASNLNNCRFLFADDIMDTAVCRMIWEIDSSIKGEESQKVADEIAAWINTRAKAFIQFAGEVCENYFLEKQPF